MGIEPFLVGSAVDCVLAQRLARRLCKVPPAVYADSGGPHPRPIPGSPARRCPRCTRRWAARTARAPATAGRLALHEIMPVTPAIERLASARASANEVEQVAHEEGAW